MFFVVSHWFGAPAGSAFCGRCGGRLSGLVSINIQQTMPFLVAKKHSLQKNNTSQATAGQRVLAKFSA